MKKRVLVVDDDKDITRLLQSYLAQAGYEVQCAFDGETALHSLHSDRPDLLLLDLMLPDRDGWNITRTLRADPRLADLPIIMITARIEDVDKILGLELGADDYVTKPFNPREVVARVNALLRRALRDLQTSQSSMLEFGELRMDVDGHTVTLAGEPVDLTVTEYNILRVLMENPGYAFTRAELFERGMGYVYGGVERTLDSHIKNLRQKLGDNPQEPHYVQTVYGVGYRMRNPGRDGP